MYREGILFGAEGPCGECLDERHVDRNLSIEALLMQKLCRVDCAYGGMLVSALSEKGVGGSVRFRSGVVAVM